MGTIIITSILISVLKDLILKFHSFNTRICGVLKDSKIYKLITALREETARSFRFSFLGKVTEDNKNYSLVLLTFIDNSKYFRNFTRLFKFFKNKIENCIIGSKIVKLFKLFKERFYLFPIRFGSVFIICAILTNILIYSLANIRIGLSGWVMRVVLMFIGINGLNSHINWEELKKTSYFLGRLNNSCKI